MTRWGSRESREAASMSLKAFHIAFIVVSTLLLFFFAGYAFQQMTGGGRLFWVATSLVLALGMLVYGRRFLDRMKTLRVDP